MQYDRGSTGTFVAVFFCVIIAIAVTAVLRAIYRVATESPPVVEQKEKEYVIQGQRLCLDDKCWYYNGKEWERIYNVR